VEGSIVRTNDAAALRAPLTPLEPLFWAATQPLLSPPSSPPPRKVANRWKTLAGVTVVRTVNYSLRRESDRLMAKRKARPTAQAAEEFVCRGLGIVQDSEVITELAMQEFARRFEGDIPGHVLQALRELFQVGSHEDDDIDEALLGHGGAAGLELGDEIAPGSESAA
jgi:hypothetical protein